MMSQLNFLHAKKSLLDALVFKKYQDLATQHIHVWHYNCEAQCSF